MRTHRVVVLGIALLLCLPVVGTQVVAHQLRYASWLGKPLLKVAGMRLYAPHAYAVWSWKYDRYYPHPSTGACMPWRSGFWVVRSSSRSC